MNIPETTVVTVVDGNDLSAVLLLFESGNNLSGSTWVVLQHLYTMSG